MTQKAAAQPTTNSPSGRKDHNSLRTLALDLLDTAWRIAVPVTMLAVIGIVLDNRVHTAPLLTISGTIAGFVIAGWLVKAQLGAVEQDEEQS